MLKILKSKSSLIWLTLLAGLARFYDLGTHGLWYDETFTVFVARIPFHSGLEFLLVDSVHPPLFYWLEKAWLMIIGINSPSEFVVRIPAAIAGTLCIPAVYLFVDRWRNHEIALVAAMLLALSPFHIWYSQDARMYSLLGLLSILTMWAYTSILDESSRGRQLFFVVVSGLSYLTHYFALFFPLIQFVHLVIRLRDHHNNLRQWVGLQIMASVPLLFWIYKMYSQSGSTFGISWIPTSTFGDLFITLMNFTVGYALQLTGFHWFVLALSLVLVFISFAGKSRNGSLHTLLLLWAFLPQLIILLISIRQPSYVDRFFIFTQPAFLILVAVGIFVIWQRFKVKTNIWNILNPGFGIGMLLVVAMVFGDYWTFVSPHRQQKEDWRGAYEFISDQIANDEIVIVRIVQMFVPMQYYAPNDLSVSSLQVNQETHSLDELAAGYKGIWMMYWNGSSHNHALSQPQMFDPELETDPIARKWLNNQGLPLIGQRNFRGITLLHFRASQ